MKMNEPLAVREAPAGYRVTLDAPRIRPSYKQTDVAALSAKVEAHLNKMGFQP